MDIGWVQLGIAIVIFILGLVAQAAQFGYKVAKIQADIKAEFNALIDLKEAEYDKKVCRVYIRLDEHKAQCDDKFISKEMCALMNNGLHENMARLEKKIDLLLEKRISNDKVAA